MDTKGQHLIIDAYGCQADILNDEGRLKDLLIKAVNDVGMEILSVYFHSFTPQGVTGVIVLSTSHFSIHTWPEHQYAAFDLYTCGSQELWPALNEILIQMQAENARVYEVARGDGSGKLPVMRRINFKDAGAETSQESRELFQLRDDRGNEWDMKALREMLYGKHTIHYHGSSPFQDIVLVEGNDLRLYLNQELQFSSLDERHYHEALVYPAMETAASTERVLILGGGDGLALREVLKYPDVKHVDLVDIDPVMIELSKTNPALLAQNNRSFHDSRVTAHVEDAIKYIASCKDRYDVIIIDFPDPVDENISTLYTKELFKDIADLLSKEGALVCQSNSPEDAPVAFWSVGETLSTTGLNTLAYVVVVPSFGLWGFHLATREKMAEKFPEISVPHQALPANMNHLLMIPESIMEEREDAIVNSKSNLQLHEIYQQEIENWD
ncbi:adenosylmethionine decarboxylase [Peribacillus saganii]|uniref:S-adenosylmethionine decarboxylase proenzyme n=1 Tax=Peribacillus saganii TaxID=2303992 RepID=A0A372LIK9_9BACI|nr:adenosylmethionine decarboxylase [Peribacillus saganii]RFU66186.1 adenosylmethionine decarboxylase [Peribacillus saganii]